MSTPVERLIEAAESMTPDEIHHHPMAALDKLRALSRELRLMRAFGVVTEEQEWDGPHIPGPGDIMLMLAYWRSQDEDWAEEASSELVARFPALDAAWRAGRVPVKQEGADDA